MQNKVAIIIGAGPAGLTAAYELLTRSDVKPIVLEMSSHIGGISRTVNYNGNRLDMGGHRFFSKSAKVTQWWLDMLPLQGAPARDEILLDEASRLAPRKAPDPEKTDLVMLVRRRLSRIFYLRKFFNYPVSLSLETLVNLGAARTMRIGLSYLRRAAFPIRAEASLEDFLINRFGDELYRTFFKDYTEKVWGVKPADIKPEWGAQRIKGLSVTRVLAHALRKTLPKALWFGGQAVETSLIEQFHYPKLGPGQMWEQVALRVTELGGELRMGHRVTELALDGDRVASLTVQDSSGATYELAGDCFLSTMPVRELVAGMGKAVPEAVRRVAQGLVYRDFITVGVLLRRLRLKNTTKYATMSGIIPDLWVYIQEKDVKIGRLQVFNNWSPYMVSDPDTVWVGVEYFCTEGDALHSMAPEELKRFAVAELAQLGIIDPGDVLDATIEKVDKAYPAYFGSYDEFAIVQAFTDALGNLFLIGRNGQHRYNNMDHSMLTAMAAVDNIIAGDAGKANIWSINADQEYHEQK